MNYPKVNITTEYTEDFTSQYLCFLAKKISMGEYQNNGFVVVPYLEKQNGKSVYFPDLPYSKNFWKVIGINNNKNLSTDFPKSTIDEVKDLLSKHFKKDYEKEIQKIENDWLKIEKDFFKDIENFLDFKKALSKVNRIDVLVTPFGTIGSFNPPRIGNKFNLKLTSRVDLPAGNIAAGILQNLYIIDTKLGGEIGEDKYIKRMSAVSFVFEHTIFKKYYPTYQNILKDNYNENLELLTKSNKYLKSLGFEAKSIQIDSSSKVFSIQESKLISKLIQNKNKVVTFDEVADCLWGKDADDKFSLESIAKVVENIRKKIREHGVNKEVIFTKRGRGYVFVG